MHNILLKWVWCTRKSHFNIEGYVSRLVEAEVRATRKWLMGDFSKCPNKRCYIAAPYCVWVYFSVNQPSLCFNLAYSRWIVELPWTTDYMNVFCVHDKPIYDSLVWPMVIAPSIISWHFHKKLYTPEILNNYKFIDQFCSLSTPFPSMQSMLEMDVNALRRPSHCL